MITDKKILKHLISRLSKRQLDILQLLADDNRPIDIAEKLKIGVKTIEAEVFKLRSQFDCKGTAGLIYLAYKNKLIR